MLEASEAGLCVWESKNQSKNQLKSTNDFSLNNPSVAYCLKNKLTKSSWKLNSGQFYSKLLYLLNSI